MFDPFSRTRGISSPTRVFPSSTSVQKCTTTRKTLLDARVVWSHWSQPGTPFPLSLFLQRFCSISILFACLSDSFWALPKSRDSYSYREWGLLSKRRRTLFDCQRSAKIAHVSCRFPLYWLQLRILYTCPDISWIEYLPMSGLNRDPMGWKGRVKCHHLRRQCKLLGPVVQKPVNANVDLKVNQGFCFFC